MLDKIISTIGYSCRMDFKMKTIVLIQLFLAVDSLTIRNQPDKVITKRTLSNYFNPLHFGGPIDLGSVHNLQNENLAGYPSQFLSSSYGAPLPTPFAAYALIYPQQSPPVQEVSSVPLSAYLRLGPAPSPVPTPSPAPVVTIPTPIVATPQSQASNPPQRVASLGSGSLGYTYIGNGKYALGSGSLGYSGPLANSNTQNQTDPASFAPIYRGPNVFDNANNQASFQQVGNDLNYGSLLDYLNPNQGILNAGGDLQQGNGLDYADYNSGTNLDYAQADYSQQFRPSARLQDNSNNGWTPIVNAPQNNRYPIYNK